MEAIALYLGAKNVATLDYVQITSTDPRITTTTPDRFRRDFLEGKMAKFDAVLSFSSLEHSGLGRYGDPLDPFGDLIEMAKAW